MTTTATSLKSSYDDASEVYDYDFEDWDGMMARYVDFIKPVFSRNNVRSVLDCSCGTGLQAIGLALEGYEVTGSDISEGMLRVARKNALEHHASVNFVQSSILDLRKDIHQKFDAVISMGNAFTHLLTDEEAVEGLKNIHEILRNDNGVCMLDIWNYVTLGMKRKRFLPMVTNDNAIVVQVRDFLESDCIDVNFLYFIRSNGQWRFKNPSVRVRAITTDQLQKFLVQAGFRNISVNVDVLWVRAVAYTSPPTLKTLSTGLAGVSAPSLQR